MQQSVRVFHLKEITSGRSNRGNPMSQDDEHKIGETHRNKATWNKFKAMPLNMVTINTRASERQKIDISPKFIGMLDSLS